MWGGLGALACVSLAACGTGAVFEPDESVLRAEVDAAVQRALERERNWQTRFIERRTETMLTDQRALAERLAALERKTTAISNRIDEIRRRTPATAGYVETDRSLSSQNEPASEPGPPPVSRPITLVPAGSDADQPEPTSAVPPPAPPSQPAPAPAPNSPTVFVPPADPNELENLKHDLTALIAAIADIQSARRNTDAVFRARLERLELRTRQLVVPAVVEGAKGMHVASYRRQQSALVGWETLRDRYPILLGKLTPTLTPVETVSGRYVRLFVGVGLGDRALAEIRDGLRANGEYATILTVAAQTES